MNTQVLRFPGAGGLGSAPGLQPYKFEPPVRPRGLRARPDKHDELTAGLQDPVTYLVGPCGSGKTTLLADWMAQTTWTTAWLSVCPADTSALRFIVHLCAAVQGLRPESIYPLDGLLSYPEDVALEALLAEHVVIPLSRSGAQVAILIDDFHRVAGDRRVEAALGWLFDHMPSGLHLTLALEAEDQVERLNAKRRDLSWVRLAPADVQVPDSPALSSQLVKLSIFERVCGPLAAAIGVQGFEALCEGSSYLVKEGRHSVWYKVHSSLQGHPGLSAIERVPLHAQAAAWYLEHGHCFEAVRHHIAAGADSQIDVGVLVAQCIERNELAALDELLSVCEPSGVGDRVAEARRQPLGTAGVVAALAEMRGLLGQSDPRELKLRLTAASEPFYKLGLHRTRTDAELGLYRIEVALAESRFTEGLAEAERCLSILALVDDEQLRVRLQELVRQICPRLGSVYGPRPRLTARAYRVLKALSETQALPAAAARLGIGLGSARVYLSEAQEQLGVAGPTQALRLFDPEHFE